MNRQSSLSKPALVALEIICATRNLSELPEISWYRHALLEVSKRLRDESIPLYERKLRSGDPTFFCDACILELQDRQGKSFLTEDGEAIASLFALIAQAADQTPFENDARAKLQHVHDLLGPVWKLGY